MLNDNGAKLGIPKDIKETAALIYRRAVEKNLIRGRSIESIVCASIYAACRMVNLPRTLDEISVLSLRIMRILFWAFAPVFTL